jgi:hypothetical protein
MKRERYNMAAATNQQTRPVIREYQDGPEKQTIEARTKAAGEAFKVTICDFDRIHLTSFDRGINVDANPWITVRGVRYSVSIDLIWYDPSQDPHPTDGRPTVAGWYVTPDYQEHKNQIDGTTETRTRWYWRRGLYATRENAFSYDSTTPAAKASLIEIAEEAANRWSARPEAPGLLRAAGIASLNNDARSREEDLEKARAEVFRLEVQLTNLEEKIAQAEHDDRVRGLAEATAQARAQGAQVAP